MTSATDRTSTRLIIGCGYLGRRIARRWRDAGDEVFAITRSTEHASKLADEGIRPIVGDVLNPESLRDLPSVNTLLYAVGFDRSSRPSKREVYVDGLRNVLANLPSDVDRFLYVSSTSVYGQSDAEWIDESSPCEPDSERGRICLEAEQLLRSTLRDRVLMNVLRLSGIYGPGRLLARIDALRASRPLPGNSNGWLNLIHVDDAATAVITCAARSHVPETLLVSDDRPIPRRTYYETLAKLVSAPTPQYDMENSATTGLGKRCRNRQLHEALGMSLRFPTIHEGLPHAVGDLPFGS